MAVFFILVNSTNGQVLYSLTKHTLPSGLYESSGLYVQGNYVFSHNDGGNPAVLYRLTKKGELVDSVQIIGLSNIDWEDVSCDNGKIYIAETGNNFHIRRDLAVLILDGNFHLLKRSMFSYQPQKTFPPSDNDREFDCEALQVIHDTAYLFTKSWSQPYKGVTYEYMLPLSADSLQQLKPIDSFTTGKKEFLEGSITSCAASPQKKYFTLLSCNNLFLFFNFPGNRFLQGNCAVFRLEGTSQREAVAFDTDSTLYISDERWANMVGGHLYSYNIQPYIDGRIPYSAPEINSFKIKSNGKNRYKCDITTAQLTGELELCLYTSTGKELLMLPCKNVGKGKYLCELGEFGSKPAYVHIYHNKRLVCSRSW